MTKNETYFFIAWFFFLLSLLIESTEFFLTHDFASVTKGMRYLSYLICVYIIIKNTLKKKNIAVFIFILTVFGITCLASTNKTMLLYLLLLVAAFYVNDRLIVRSTLWMQGIFLAIIVILSQIGILHDYIFGMGTDRIRHGLGFGWTTTGPILYFYFLLIFIYIKKEKFNILDFVILETINIFFTLKTDTKMAFGLSTIFLIFFFIQGIHKGRWKVLSKVKYFYLFIPSICCLIGFLSAICYSPDNQLLVALNNAISNRLALGHNAILNYKFTIFGQPIEWKGYNIKQPVVDVLQYNYVDSSYLQLALEYGLAFIAVIIGIYTYGIYKAEKNSDYYLVFIYIFILVFALTEPRLMNFAFNPFPLVIFSQMGHDVVKHIRLRKVCKNETLTFAVQREVKTHA